MTGEHTVLNSQPQGTGDVAADYASTLSSAVSAPGAYVPPRDAALGFASDEFVRSFRDVYTIPAQEYDRYNVKRGLRNADGTGVIAGLTRISNVHGYVRVDGQKVPDDGSLTYRGFEINDLVDYAVANGIDGYDTVVFLLLFGRLPSADELASLTAALTEFRDLPTGFIKGVVADRPPRDVMNQLIRSILELYPYDEHGEDIGSREAVPHEINAALSLIAKIPRLAVLGHYAADAYYNNGSMIIHPVLQGQTSAEAFLSLLRPDRSFTAQEARLLDIMMMLHAEHGGGNNSTFTCRCLTSSGTDPYSAYAGAVASLKGPKHGGANLRALEQQEDCMATTPNWRDDDGVADYLKRTFAKETFDRSGLVYGMGHAVYTKSDPRAVICKRYAKQLAAGTEFEERFALIEAIERLTPEVLAQQKGSSKVLCANIDMYSGLVYTMLGIPKDLFTPLFACARMAGWAAHRFEEIYGAARIMRPAYQAIGQERRMPGVDTGSLYEAGTDEAGEDETAGMND